jgi:hypothetical protein
MGAGVIAGHLSRVDPGEGYARPGGTRVPAARTSQRLARPSGSHVPAARASQRLARYWFVFVTRMYLSASLRLDSLRSLGSALAAGGPNCTRGERCRSPRRAPQQETRGLWVHEWRCRPSRQAPRSRGTSVPPLGTSVRARRTFSRVGCSRGAAAAPLDVTWVTGRRERSRASAASRGGAKRSGTSGSQTQTNIVRHAGTCVTLGRA